jgi:hypothetical protein
MRFSLLTSHFSLFTLLLLSAEAQNNNLKYTITVSLDHKSRSLDGFLKADLTNNTSDSIHYLWFNLYPNAFKSDRTAFSEYLLDKRRTDFYFADQSKRGYINRLDFRSGDNILKTEDHPLYIDVVKVFLDKPLAPSATVEVTTPFHVKVPFNFDGIGYYGGEYTLRYWYPAVAEFVKPLTNTDSSSNAIADYDIKLTLASGLAKNTLTELPQKKENDSISVIHFVGQNQKDYPLVINPRVGLHTPPFIKEKPGQFLERRTKQLLSHAVLPAAGYNKYDGLQLGVFAHGSIPGLFHAGNVNFYVSPLYTFRSKSVAGIAGAFFSAYPKKYIKEFQVGFNASAFSYADGVDTNSNKVFAKLLKVVPYVKVKLPSKLKNIEKTLSFKSYIINERDLEFVKYSVDSFFYPAKGEYVTRFVNELTFDYSSDRVLYPYRAQLQVQQGLTWYRLNATGNYFLNYPKGGGMNLRVFAAKFGYIGNLSSSEKFAVTRYMPKLTAVRGDEDYTYSNYFIGRSEFEGLAGQQMMMRDGGLKLRTDLFQGLQGRSDNWVAAINLNTSIPKLFPIDIPLKIFFDAGTYSEAWDDDNPNPRFLYVAGLQLSLFKEFINIYAPVLYSSSFRDQLKSVPDENTFLKRLSFSIDLQRLDLKKLF